MHIDRVLSGTHNISAFYSILFKPNKDLINR